MMDFSKLQEKVNSLRREHEGLKEDSAFVVWFLTAYLIGDEERAMDALAGEGGDKSIDAIFFDNKSKQVNIVQGKFHESYSTKHETRGDIFDHVEVARVIWGDDEMREAYTSKLNERTKALFSEAYKMVREEKYSLRLLYASTGKCSESLLKEARKCVSRESPNAEFVFIGGQAIQTIFHDYVFGVAPGVPSLKLRVFGEVGGSDGVINRFDNTTGIGSWIFSMSTKDVGDLYNKSDISLFARNIRGYLGAGGNINLSMVETIEQEPQYFWYFNNGITFVCDSARMITESNERYLEVERPQIINGQQTTRTLSEKSSKKASVLVRVVSIPGRDRTAFNSEEFISSIVRATNWQNAIKASDLISNDEMQVYLEREFRKYKYCYLRKRQSKGETKRIFGQAYRVVSKEEVAQAVAATMFDPALLKKGKEILFSGEYYKHIFHESDVSYYIALYRLSKLIKLGSRQNPKRPHAIWHVQHFLWDQIGETISDHRKISAFIKDCESGSDELKPLHQSISVIFDSYLTFFRANKGSGESELNIASFFKKDGLGKSFNRYWRSRGNVSKNRKVQKLLDQYLSKL